MTAAKRRCLQIDIVVGGKNADTDGKQQADQYGPDADRGLYFSGFSSAHSLASGERLSATVR